LGGEIIPERESLWVVMIRRPVVQRALAIGPSQYAGADGITAFRNDLTDQLGALGAQAEVRAQELADITRDLVNEGLTFADWPATLREVFIRNVGYRAEASLRALMVEHQERYTQQKQAADTDIEQAKRDRAADITKHVLERRFRTNGEMAD